MRIIHAGDCSENYGFRIAQVVRCYSKNGISCSKNQCLNSESCSENAPELSESSENGPFTPRAFLPEIRVVPRLLNSIQKIILLAGHIHHVMRYFLVKQCLEKRQKLLSTNACAPGPLLDVSLGRPPAEHRKKRARGGRGRGRVGREGLWLEGKDPPVQWGGGGDRLKGNWGRTHVWGFSKLSRKSRIRYRFVMHAEIPGFGSGN